VCRSPWPKPVGVGLEVLLIDRLQHHDDRPLEDFVLKRWYPDWSGLLRPGSFRDMHPSHRRCPVGTGFGSVQKRTQIGNQVNFVVRSGYPVHTRSAVPARAPVGHEQPGEVEVVVQGSESHLRGLLRKLRYPLLPR